MACSNIADVEGDRLELDANKHLLSDTSITSIIRAGEENSHVATCVAFNMAGLAWWQGGIIGCYNYEEFLFLQHNYQ